MANLKLRSTTSATDPGSTSAKGSALTHAEMDSNLILINNSKLDNVTDTFTGTLTVAGSGGSAVGAIQLNDNDDSNSVTIKALGTIASSYTLTLPPDDGTSGQVLTTDGSGNLSFTSKTVDTTDLVSDTTPQLGGDLDTQAFALKGTDVVPSTGSLGGFASGGQTIRLHSDTTDQAIRTQQNSNASNITFVTDITGASTAANSGSGLIYAPLNIQVRDHGHATKTRTTFDIGVPYRGGTGTTITQGSVTGKLLDIDTSERKIYLQGVSGGSFATSAATTGKVTGTVTAVNSIGTNAVELTYDTDFASTATASDLADVGFARISARDVLNTEGIRTTEPEMHLEAGRIALESNGTKMIDCEADGSLKIISRASNKHIVVKPDQTGATGDSGPLSGFNTWGGGVFHLNGVQSIEAGTDTPSTDLLFNTGLQITGRSDDDNSGPNFPTLAFKHHDGEGSVTSGSDNRDTGGQGYGNIWFQRYNKDADDGAIDLVENGQILGGFFGGGSISNLGWYTSGFAQTASATCGMFMRATDDWSTSSVPTRMEFQTTPAGSLNKHSVLDLNGDSVVVNPTNLDVDFQVDGDSNDAILKVDANKEIVSTGGVFQVYAASGDPSSNLVEGQMYFNSATKKFMGYNGTAWVVIGSQS